MDVAEVIALKIIIYMLSLKKRARARLCLIVLVLHVKHTVKFLSLCTTLHVSFAIE